jgi:hypothetical protein
VLLRLLLPPLLRLPVLGLLLRLRLRLHALVLPRPGPGVALVHLLLQLAHGGLVALQRHALDVHVVALRRGSQGRHLSVG